MTVSKMSLRALDEVVELERALFSDPWRREAFEASLLHPNRSFFTAAAPDGSILGYCGVQWAGEQADILNIGVAPAARRQGIATALLRAAIDAARAAGARTVFLEVRAQNIPAQRLYEKTGFRKVGVRAGYYNDPPEDGWVYRLEVQA